MLLDEVGSPWLKVVIDPANLMRAGDFPRMEEILDEAFDWLGKDIVLAHAKNPATGRDPAETITVQEYLEQNRGRVRLLATVMAKFWAVGRVTPRFAKRTLASEIPRSLVDLQEFYFAYIRAIGRGRLSRGRSSCTGWRRMMSLPRMGSSPICSISTRAAVGSFEERSCLNSTAMA